MISASPLDFFFASATPAKSTATSAAAAARRSQVPRFISHTQRPRMGDENGWGLPRAPALPFLCASSAHLEYLQPQAMPPRTRSTAATFHSLPLPLALRIFALLPVDARLLAVAVCRAWRAMLAERSLWTRLDLAEASSVAYPNNALLRAAAARARGQLEFLRTTMVQGDCIKELLVVVAENAGTLRELKLVRTEGMFCLFSMDAATVAELLRAAPALRLFETSVHFVDADSLPVLRKEPPFGPLLHLTHAFFNGSIAVGWPDVAQGLALHTTLETVVMSRPWPVHMAVSNAVVDALLSLQQLRSLAIFTHIPAPALARILGCPALKSLVLWGDHSPLLDSPASASLLCRSALRANTRIETLKLNAVALWHNMPAATALMATLQTLQSLTHLEISSNAMQPELAAAAGSAVAALVAQSPALKTLDVSFCDFGDVGLRPIFDALPQAHNLESLDCSGNQHSDAFAVEHMLPAVRACAPLRQLSGGSYPALHTAMQILEQRRRRDQRYR